MAQTLKMPAVKKPKERGRSRRSRNLLLLLLLFFIALLATLFVNSSISRIERIEIAGLRHVAEAELLEAAQLEEGQHFFGAGARSLEQRIAALNVVAAVQVKKSFPGLIAIQVVEHPEVAYRLAGDGSREVLLANGVALTLGEGAVLADKPVLTGWSEDDPHLVPLCVELSKIPAGLLSDISEILPDPSGAYPDKIKMYTHSKFEVYTTVSYIADKIEYMRGITESYEPGYIHLLDAVVHRPYAAAP